MKRFIKNICGLFLVALVVCGCKDKGNPSGSNNSGDTETTVISTISFPADSAKLEGKIKDEQGNILSGVGIHYIFELKSKSLAKPGNICPSTRIDFTIPKTTHVKAQVLRWFTRDSLATLCDEDHVAGVLSLSMEDLKMTNGFYVLRFTADNKTSEHAIYMINTNNSLLYNSKPLATSNQDGSFSLPRGIFGLGYPIVQYNEVCIPIDTLYVSANIQLLLCKTGFNPLLQPLDLNALGTGEKQFVMTKAK